MNNMGVFQELWNNFHFLTTEQIQGHHLVPLSLRGSHPSSLSSLRHFFGTVSGLLSGPALQKSCSVLGSSKEEASYRAPFSWGHSHPQSCFLHLHCLQRHNVLKTCILHSYNLIKSSLFFIRNGCRLYKCLLPL